jgi:hypothetical protein
VGRAPLLDLIYYNKLTPKNIAPILECHSIALFPVFLAVFKYCSLSELYIGSSTMFSSKNFNELTQPYRTFAQVPKGVLKNRNYAIVMQ